MTNPDSPTLWRLFPAVLAFAVLLAMGPQWAVCEDTRTIQILHHHGVMSTSHNLSGVPR